MRWLVLIGAGGCAGDAVGTDGVDTDTGTVATGPTAGQLFDEVLITCAFAGCHGIGSATAQNGLEYFDASSAVAALVDQASTGSPSEVFVVPSDPDSSYLVKKLEGATDIAGGAMPPPAGGLTTEELQLVRDWIAAGALDN